MVHWTLVGSAPPDETSDTVNVTVEPGVALPDDTDIVTCCAFAGLAVRTATPSHKAQGATETKPRHWRKSEFHIRTCCSISLETSIDPRPNPLEMGLSLRSYFGELLSCKGGLCFSPWTPYLGERTLPSLANKTEPVKCAVTGNFFSRLSGKVFCFAGRLLIIGNFVGSLSNCGTVATRYHDSMEGFEFCEQSFTEGDP